MKKQPIIYNSRDPQYDDIKAKYEAEEIAEDEVYEMKKDKKITERNK